MLRNGLLFVLCLTTILLRTSGQIDVSEQAKQDQAAGKLWSALGNNLSLKLGCPTSNVQAILQDKTNLSEDHLRLFLSYFLNYDVEAFEMSQIRHRYPHYDEKAIQEDMDYFVDLGLITEDSSGWSLRARGVEIVDDYWGLKLEEALACEEKSPHLTILISIGRKIVEAYKAMKGLPSLHLRFNNRPEGFEEFPMVLQAFVFQQELSAVFNDIGHHRFDNLGSTGSKQWISQELSPLAQELMGATRNHRVYAIERCYHQRFWRVGVQKCDEAVSELLDLGLIEMRTDSINQTSFGRDFFKAADDLANDYIYGAWNYLSHDEYQSFQKALEWLNE